METRVKCPKCGSLNGDSEKQGISLRGCLLFLIFRELYIAIYLYRFLFALLLFLLIDWWMAIYKHFKKEEYTWVSKKIMRRKRKYICRCCGYHFKA